jgi:putative membrane protein
MGFRRIFWVIIVILIVVLAWQYLNRKKGGEASGNSALEILKQRYVRGEISKEEYEVKK